MSDRQNISRESGEINWKTEIFTNNKQGSRSGESFYKQKLWLLFIDLKNLAYVIYSCFLLLQSALTTIYQPLPSSETLVTRCEKQQMFYVKTDFFLFN